MIIDNLRESRRSWWEWHGNVGSDTGFLKKYVLAESSSWSEKSFYAKKNEMQVIRTIAEWRQVRQSLPTNHSVGFVPTMGALHAGHLSLLHSARKGSYIFYEPELFTEQVFLECDVVVGSVFVNPMQFAPDEDFEKYPRSFEADCEALNAAKVDFVFAPEVEEMYPAGFLTEVVVREIPETQEVCKCSWFGCLSLLYSPLSSGSFSLLCFHQMGVVGRDTGEGIMFSGAVGFVLLCSPFSSLLFIFGRS